MSLDQSPARAERSASESEWLWGATAIAAYIGASTRKTYYLLEAKLIPAKKVGDSWCASKRALDAALRGVAA
jgi:excisionase family DNA binding protein